MELNYTLNKIEDRVVLRKRREVYDMKPTNDQPLDVEDIHTTYDAIVERYRERGKTVKIGIKALLGTGWNTIKQLDNNYDQSKFYQYLQNQVADVEKFTDIFQISFVVYQT